jgi:hypothetical protein
MIKQYYSLLWLLVIGSSLLLYGCYHDRGDKLYPGTASCDTSNVHYNTTIKPIITSNCLNQGCHTSGNPSGGFNFESYNGLISVIPGNRLVNAINYRTGGSKNMPPTGKLPDCEIRKIEAWIGHGFPND